MLIGEYHHNIDDKGRLTIPSKFREEIGEKFIVTRGLDGCLFAYSMEEWDKIVTKLNILYDVCFNKECGGHAALYFNKEADSLKYVIKLAESLDEEDIKRYEEYAKKEVQERYSWNFICSEYETLFLKEE